MKVLEVTRENLEDLLAYDDLFLDYFNAFLSLPVFPQALAYDRLTGAFEEFDISTSSTVSSSLLGVTSKSQHYGPTNIEREKMLEWAKEERLPVFLRAQLFRELKLCKLLLRPLVDRNSASRGSSRQIRGYSRQSESYVSSLSNSADNSANDALDDEDGWPELQYSELYKYCRPGSRALSVPIKISLQSEESENRNVSDITSTSSFSISKSAGLQPVRHTSTGHHVQHLPALNSTLETANRSQSSTAVVNNNNSNNNTKRSTRISSQVEIFHTDDSAEDGQTQSSRERKQNVASSTEEAFLRGSRVLSAPLNYDYYLKRPFNNCDFEQLFGEIEPEPLGKSYVTFEEEEVDEQQTEREVRNLEGQLKITIQQLKENVLGTYSGFEAFKAFLENTSGTHLFNFWLDCEFYKDMMEDDSEIDFVEQRNILFRDIQDKYKFNLSQDAKDQIAKMASNMGLSHTIFLRTQYDILRRLRVYWVPRFLIHFERTKHFSPAAPNHRQLLLALRKATPYNPVPFFPSISLVRSAPMRPDEILHSSEKVIQNFINRTHTSDKLISSQSLKPSRGLVARSSKERFLLALSADRISGGPFEKYLARQPNQNLISNLMFWQDVTEYGATEDKSADRLLRLQHAWAIYNKYLSADSSHNIDLSNKDRDMIHQNLLKARDFVDSSVYDVAKYQAVQKLEDNWIRFLKEDLKAFLDCRVRPDGGSPPSTAEAIEIIVTDTEVVIKRPRPWVRRYPGSTMSERARRLHRALSLAEDMDEERHAKNKLLKIERRKEMERERKKAIRAAYKRQRENRLGISKEVKPKSETDDGIQIDGDITEKDIPTYTELHSNKQVMAMFRKYLNEEDNKEMIHLMSLNNDLTTHFDIENKQKKEAHALHIYKTFLDEHSKKYVTMPDNIKSKIEAEHERPKTATLKEMCKNVLSRIEDCFKEFLVFQAEEFGVSPKDLSTMSQTEIAMRLSNDSYNWKKGKGKGKREDDTNSERGVEMRLDSVTLRVFENDIDKQDPPKTHKEKRETKVSFSKHKYLRPPVRDRWGRNSRLDREDSRGSSFDNRGSSLSIDSSPARGRGHRRQSSGRCQPSKEDKIEFLQSLGESAAGQLTITMLYFYKYLVKHGEQDGMPLIDKDLFFYIEVQKFKAFNHAYSNEDILKAKAQSMVDCFLESVSPPSLQIDISSDCHNRTLKAANRYIQGKEMVSSIFDEAQFAVFKELLPYWAGFKKNSSIPADRRIPETKYQKMVRRRRDAIENYKTPETNFNLPPIPEGALPIYSISLSDGVRLKELNDDSSVGTPSVGRRSSRLVPGSVENLRKSRKSLLSATTNSRASFVR